MVRWGMVIYLKKCIACHTCTLICKIENGTPFGIFLSKVLEREVGTYPDVKKAILPVSCNHCKEPPCEAMCPTKAITKRDDGIVVTDYERCIGCRRCIAACPYNVRTYLEKINTYFPGHTTPYEEIKYKKFKEATVVGCNFCVERVEKGLEPACVTACPTGARYFGDLDDPQSEVSQLIKDRGGFQLKPDLKTEPSVYYLPR